MSISQNRQESVVKQEHILDAAIKRFSWFGVHKTTLTEIADDLAVSKPSLAYYFNDKQGLVNAVGNKILNEFLESVQSAFHSAVDVQSALQHMLQIKLDFFKKYFLLAVQVDAPGMANVPNEFTEKQEFVREQTTGLIKNLLDKGIATGELKPTDTNTVSRLILDTLSAFEHCSHHKKGLPDINAFDDVYERQMAVIDLMINGLKA